MKTHTALIWVAAGASAWTVSCSHVAKPGGGEAATPSAPADAGQASAAVPDADGVCREPSAISGIPGAVFKCSALFDPAGLDGRALKTTPELQSHYERLQQTLFWRKWIDADIDFLTFIRLRNLEAAKASGRHGSETYGFDAYREYRRAEDWLNSIPVGRLELTPELIKNVHLMVFNSVSSPLKRALDPVVPDGLMLDKGGVFKRRYNFGPDPMFSPLTESQYQALKSNPWMDRFVEWPWPFSKPGKRRGLIVYGAAGDVETKLAGLLQWYSANKGKMDPIELAATFQVRLVSIHPFVDGNGRTSTLLMNRILKEFGLPPMLRTDADFDMYMSEREWANTVRAGIEDWVLLAQEMKPEDVPSVFNVNFKDGPRTALLPESRTAELVGKGIGKVDKALRERLAYMSRKLFPTSREAEIRIGGTPYLFAADGFFYNNRGIPHVIHGDALYPVADRTYFLYAENGKLGARRFTKRGLSAPHRDVFRAHFAFMKGVESGRLDPSRIRLIPYETVRAANEKGLIQLHPFEAAVFENAIRIRDTDPMAVLATARGYQTNFERAFESGAKVSAGEVIAQYQLADLKFSEYLVTARASGRADWLDAIQASRKALFDAAKKLLNEVDAAHAELAGADRQYLESHPRWRLYQEYRAHTALRYATFEEAMSRMNDQEIVLIRADNRIPRYVGFRSNQDYVDQARKLPGYETFRQWVLQSADEIKNNRASDSAPIRLLREQVPAFDALIPKVARILSARRHDTRGTEAEFERVFVDHFLHATNTPLKRSISYSTSPDLYIRSTVDEAGQKTEQIPFTFDSLDSSVYFVRAKRTEVSSNFASKFFRQFEVLSDQPVAPWRIEREFKSGDFRLPEGKTPPSIEAFFDKGFYVNKKGGG